ncbi:MAG: prephenate dehydrogenase/arogenate dehydrogenase family protein [Methanomicrobiales archaeon]|nr:prephenate dehydrogenase/arogenate dehydrogenase family protein [Methanomicrobiales archaeon]
MKAGIIGGTGKMGSLFAGVLARAGWEVMVSGRSTSLTTRDLAGKADLVMVSVPIRETVPVIRAIAPLLRQDQVICDLTSLKVAPVQAMLASRAQVIGFHPMFGPAVNGLRNQTIIATPARCREETAERLYRTFRAEGARVTVTTPEAHDRLMAVIQGITHFSTLCIAGAMQTLGTDIGEALAATSPVYRIQLDLVGRLLSQDPALYADILQMNPETGPALAAFEEAVRDLRGRVASGNPAAFEEFFRDTAACFRDDSGRATDETDRMIAFLAEQP